LRLQIKQIRRAPNGQQEVTPVGGAPPSLGRGWYQYGMAVLAGAGQPFYAIRTQDEDGAAVSAGSRARRTTSHDISAASPFGTRTSAQGCVLLPQVIKHSKAALTAVGTVALSLPAHSQVFQIAVVP
jgi:hypothetical protein